MKNSSLRRVLARIAGSACTVLCAGALFTACQDDLLVGQPSWLGESIFDELGKRGNFTETMKLIRAQEEDYELMLSKTGSVTLFAADDEAWQRFYASNPWGVTSVADLSPAQKKLLFKGNMLTSAYLVEMLGNAGGEGDDEGNCMRRTSNVSRMDSIVELTRDKYPVVNPVRVNDNGDVIDYWGRLRKQKSALFVGFGDPVMIHMMPKYMLNNRISKEDIEILSNNDIHSTGDASINGVVITEKDVTCQNGYLHIVKEVPMQLSDMASVIEANPQFSIYNRLLNRFSYPYDDTNALDEYKRLVDSTYTGRVYVRRFFNGYDDSDDGTTGYGLRDTQATDNANPAVRVGAPLPYDPAWNGYAAPGGASYRSDAAVMLVPTDDAMRDYLNNEGRDLKELYEHAGDGETAWDNAPDAVVLPLLNNTMLRNLTSAIPSLFGNINNSASEPMGIKKGDVDQVHWACNGIIYQTNKVFVAPEYVSVFYPCVIRDDKDLHLTYTVVMDDKNASGNTLAEGFYAYLNNMSKDADNPHAGYSFIIPTDQALQCYYPAVSYKRTKNGNPAAQAYKFKVTKDSHYHIAADAYVADWKQLDEKGRATIGKKASSSDNPSYNPAGKSENTSFNHFKDILNSSLATTLFHYPQQVYQAKNGGPIIVNWKTPDEIDGVAGSFQYERNYFIPVTQTVDKSRDGNGRCYIVEEEPLMSTFKSPYAALNDSIHADHFSAFASLLIPAGILRANDGAGHCTMKDEDAISYLSNYHYTIYVPENNTVQELIDAHKLPTSEMIAEITNCIATSDITGEDSLYLEREKAHMQQVVRDFVSYHIQDNAIYIHGEEHNDDVYESSCLDTLTNRFCRLWVSYLPDAEGNGRITVRDVKGNVRTVSEDVNNIMTRQYFFKNEKNDALSNMLNQCTDIYTSSFAVIHLIDAPLESSADCYYDPAEYNKVKEMIQKYPPVEKDTEK